MTYLEKYMQEHPEAERDLVVRDECPGGCYTSTSVKCLALRPVGPGEFACRNCWNQEIPETETDEKIGLTPGEKAQLAEFVDKLSNSELEALRSYINQLKERNIVQGKVDVHRGLFVFGERKDV